MKYQRKCKEIAPCIVSKVKVALKLPNKYRGNIKSCSSNYWNDVCEIIGKYNLCSQTKINLAKKKYNKI
jgi:hypothetical protein